MKTSNKLTITAILVILISLVFYDLLLKASYTSGSYKDPFKDFTTLDFKNFNSIRLNASTAANIIVEQGPFRVRVDAIAAPLTKVSQNGETLNIDVAFPGSFENSRAAYVLIISCPNLKQFDADARYMAGDRPITDTLGSEDFKWRPSIIRGFVQDSLAITEKHASSIILTGNKIKSVHAIIGLKDESRSNMVISKDNEFQNLDLNLLNRSQLQLHEATIQNLKYQLADSARLILTGAAKNLLNKK